MKKSVLILVATTVFFLLCAAGYAEELQPYAAFKVGAVMVNDLDDDEVTFKFKKGFALSGAVGTIVADFLRAEAELGFTNFGVDKLDVANVVSYNADGNVSVISLLANGYIDFKNDSPLTPFLSAGVGQAWGKMNDVSVTVSGTKESLGSSDWERGFAYQVSGGLSYLLNEKTSLDLTYRYFDVSGDLEGTHNLYVGARVSF